MRIAAVAVLLGVVPLAAWGQFGDGTYLVGVDIGPGIYRAPGGAICQWERLSGLGGEFDDIIAMDFTENSRQLVEVKATDVAFKVSACGRWEMVSEASGGEAGSVSTDMMSAVVASILLGVKDVLEPVIGAVFEIKTTARSRLALMHAEGYISDDDKEMADYVIDVMFEEIMGWPPPAD